MMGESCVCLGSKEIRVFGSFRPFFKIFEKFWRLPRHTQFSLPSFWAKLGYSRIKIDHIADSLLKLKIKIGVHLINVNCHNSLLCFYQIVIQLKSVLFVSVFSFKVLEIREHRSHTRIKVSVRQTEKWIGHNPQIFVIYGCV